VIGWLLDTNVTAEIIRTGGSARVKAWAAAADEARLYLSILTVAEYDKGIANLPDGDPRRSVYMATRDSLAARFGARVLSVSNAIVRRWGSISGTVRRDSGHPPPVIDTLLAATALEHGLYLATRNVRDVRHCGAAVFNPWEDDPAAFPIISGRRQRRAPEA
jgi:predicted nucleic acid-binding protein